MRLNLTNEEIIQNAQAFIYKFRTYCYQTGGTNTFEKFYTFCTKEEKNLFEDSFHYFKIRDNNDPNGVHFFKQEIRSDWMNPGDTEVNYIEIRPGEFNVPLMHFISRHLSGSDIYFKKCIELILHNTRWSVYGKGLLRETFYVAMYDIIRNLFIESSLKLLSYIREYITANINNERMHDLKKEVASIVFDSLEMQEAYLISPARITTITSKENIVKLFNILLSFKDTSPTRDSSFCINFGNSTSSDSLLSEVTRQSFDFFLDVADLNGSESDCRWFCDAITKTGLTSNYLPSKINFSKINTIAFTAIFNRTLQFTIKNAAYLKKYALELMFTLGEFTNYPEGTSPKTFFNSFPLIMADLNLADEVLCPRERLKALSDIFKVYFIDNYIENARAIDNVFIKKYLGAVTYDESFCPLAKTAIAKFKTGINGEFSLDNKNILRNIKHIIQSYSDLSNVSSSLLRCLVDVYVGFYANNKNSDLVFYQEFAPLDLMLKALNKDLSITDGDVINPQRKYIYLDKDSRFTVLSGQPMLTQLLSSLNESTTADEIKNINKIVMLFLEKGFSINDCLYSSPEAATNINLFHQLLLVVKYHNAAKLAVTTVKKIIEENPNIELISNENPIDIVIKEVSEEIPELLQLLIEKGVKISSYAINYVLSDHNVSKMPEEVVATCFLKFKILAKNIDNLNINTEEHLSYTPLRLASVYLHYFAAYSRFEIIGKIDILGFMRWMIDQNNIIVNDSYVDKQPYSWYLIDSITETNKYNTSIIDLISIMIDKKLDCNVVFEKSSLLLKLIDVLLIRDLVQKISPVIAKIITNTNLTLNYADKDGNTPLLNLCKKSNIIGLDLIKLILQFKINTNKKNKEGVSPLRLALNFGNQDLVELLLQNNANPGDEEKNLMGALRMLGDAKENVFKGMPRT
ncbi:MAG: ankyrin repeat domain-containing protein [Oligoflexia bacterium]|nr:ankyrin repeat domain-containing protein [Oligoflexia bacterium]